MEWIEKDEVMRRMRENHERLCYNKYDQRWILIELNGHPKNPQEFVLDATILSLIEQGEIFMPPPRRPTKYENAIYHLTPEKENGHES